MKRLLAMVLLTAVAAWAQEEEALKPEWFELCGTSERAYGFCAGYVQSVVDSIRVWRISERYCPAEDVSIEEKLTVVQDYIRANPVLRGQEAHSQILVALTMTWPCPTKDGL